MLLITLELPRVDWIFVFQVANFCLQFMQGNDVTIHIIVLKKKWFLATNIDFLIPTSVQPDVVDLSNSNSIKSISLNLKF